MKIILYTDYPLPPEEAFFAVVGACEHSETTCGVASLRVEEMDGHADLVDVHPNLAAVAPGRYRRDPRRSTRVRCQFTNPQHIVAARLDLFAPGHARPLPIATLNQEQIATPDGFVVEIPAAFENNRLEPIGFGNRLPHGILHAPGGPYKLRLAITRVNVDVQILVKVRVIYLDALPVIAVVGAGAAGLRATELLATAGYLVTLVEARDRTGGRALTDAASLGALPLDLGCQWLHDSANNAFADRSDELGAVENVAESQNWVFDGRLKEDGSTLIGEQSGWVEKALNHTDLDISAREAVRRYRAAKREETEASVRVRVSRDERVKAEINIILAREETDRNRVIDERVVREMEVWDRESAKKDALALLRKRQFARILAEVKEEDRLKEVVAERRKPPAQVKEANDRLALLPWEPHVAEARIEAESKLRSDLRAEAEKARRTELMQPHLERAFAEVDAVWLPMAIAMESELEESTEPERFSVIDRFTAEEEDETNQVAPAGYGVLIQEYATLVRALGGVQTELSWEVTSISCEAASGVSLVSRAAARVVGDAAVVTLPTPIIAREIVRFQPALPGEIATAFRALPLGHLKKIALEFSENIFGGEVHNHDLVWPVPAELGSFTRIPGIDYGPPEAINRELQRDELTVGWGQCGGIGCPKPYLARPTHECLLCGTKTRLCRRCAGNEHEAWCVADHASRPLWKLLLRENGGTFVVVAYVGGEYARKLDVSGKPSAVRAALAQLRLTVGRRVDNLYTGRFSVSDWSIDPFSLGAYSYTAVGGKGARKTLCDAVVRGRVVFAGEALWADAYGTAHGAYNTAQGAVDKVLLAFPL
jgi:monoamine oxidase